MSNLEKLTFIGHHGSPGTPSDFEEIQKLMPASTWLCHDRYNKPQIQPEGAVVQVGYSWGSVPSIESAIENPGLTKAVVLISPYLFVSKKMSPVIKTILSLPLVGNLLLSKMAPKSIAKMIIDSSYPSSVPGSYKPFEKLFSNPEILRPAMFEKDIPTENIVNYLKKLKTLPIPVFVVRGDSDKTSGDGDQFKLLANHLDFKEIIIAGGGHALPWTHTQGVTNELQKLVDNLNS